MQWYLLICLLMCFPCAIVRAGVRMRLKTRHIALIFACAILWFFMAFRAISVGVDTKHYAYVFSQFEKIPFSKVFTVVTYSNENKTWAFDFEPGYRLINKLLCVFFNGPQTITIFNSTVIMLLWYKLIRRESPDYMLSVWLLLTLGIYQTQMNVTRNAIAILMVYNGFHYLRRGRFRAYAAVCVAASLIHVAALLFLPLYWLVRRVRLTLRLSMTLILISCVVGVFFPLISPYLSALLPGRYGRYFQGTTENLQPLMVGILNGGIFLLARRMLPRKRRWEVFRRYALGVMMLTINLCFFGLNIGMDDASRIAALFGPYLVILIPQMLTLIPGRARRVNATRLLMLLCFIQYVLRMCVNNIGGTMPYAFFW